ncbi:hypothetical protein QVD17_09003 [Tagetes erecta]|uniref:Uncharacterized protein n=1 Tax=Tagetes erecta TaxID=13708 RepID=A0AAD8KZQ3_TARER|nr:hypothetical protein QVD17_09003 [Tagetes erecta]
MGMAVMVISTADVAKTGLSQGRTARNGIIELSSLRPEVTALPITICVLRKWYSAFRRNETCFILEYSQVTFLYIGFDEACLQTETEQEIENGEFVCLKTMNLNEKPRVLTLNQDLHYWPTW